MFHRYLIRLPGFVTGDYSFCCGTQATCRQLIFGTEYASGRLEFRMIDEELQTFGIGHTAASCNTSAWGHFNKKLGPYLVLRDDGAAPLMIFLTATSTRLLFTVYWVRHNQRR